MEYVDQVTEDVVQVSAPRARGNSDGATSVVLRVVESRAAAVVEAASSRVARHDRGHVGGLS